jgi:putative heme transporter
MVTPVGDRERKAAVPDDDPQGSPVDRAVGAAREAVVALRIPTWFRTLGIGAWLLLGLIGVLAVLILFFALISGLLIPLVAAVVLAAVTVPLVDRMDRWRFPRWLAAAVILLLGVAIAAGTVAIVVWGVLSQADEIGQRASKSLQEAGGALNSLNVDSEQVRALTADVLKVVGAGFVGGLVGSAATLVIGVVLGGFMLLYLLKDWREITDWAAGHIGLPPPLGRRILNNAVRSFQGYARGLTVVALANAVTMGFGAWLLGVPLVLAIAVVTFVTAYIPIFGALLSGAFAVVIALGGQGLTDALIILVIAIVANNGLTNLIMPIAFGKSLSLHPLVILVVTTGGTLLFGIFGAVLAAPVTAMAVSTYAELKASGILVEEPPVPADVVGGASAPSP